MSLSEKLWSISISFPQNAPARCGGKSATSHHPFRGGGGWSFRVIPLTSSFFHQFLPAQCLVVFIEKTEKMHARHEVGKDHTFRISAAHLHRFFHHEPTHFIKQSQPIVSGHKVFKIKNYLITGGVWRNGNGRGCHTRLFRSINQWACVFEHNLRGEGLVLVQPHNGDGFFRHIVVKNVRGGSVRPKSSNTGHLLHDLIVHVQPTIQRCFGITR